MLIEKVENLRADAEEVMDELKTTWRLFCFYENTNEFIIFANIKSKWIENLIYSYFN